MRALVTGASGFVGSAVARALLAAGGQVRVLLRESSDRANVKDLPVEIALGDLTAAPSLHAALAGCDALFHVAADYRLGARDPAQLYRTNVEGTRNLLSAAAAAGVRKIVYTSSVATMGIPADGSPGDERTPVSLAAMIGHYKRSKFLAEQLVLDAAAAGTPAIIVNPSTPVGPGDIKPTPTGQLVRDAAAGRMPAYVDTGLNIMTLEHILGVIAKIVGRPAPRIRLPYAAVLPIAVAAEVVARLTGRSGRVTLEGVRMSRKRMFFSSAKATRELGYRWRPPAQAFEDAVRWFRAHGALPG
jgi:dihydroflavonol-4-reductase